MAKAAVGSRGSFQGGHPEPQGMASGLLWPPSLGLSSLSFPFEDPALCSLIRLVTEDRRLGARPWCGLSPCGPLGH